MADRRLGLSFAAAHLAAAFLVLGGCSAALQANKRSPGKLEDGQFKPERPPAANYGPDPALTCPQFGANGALDEEVRLRAGDKKRAMPDGRLCALADTLLGWNLGNGAEMPAENVRSFLSHYFGIPGSVRRLLLHTIETEDVKNIATSVVDMVASFTPTAQKPIYGFMSERVKKGVTRVVLVLYDDAAQIEPLPRTLPADGTATLSGTLEGEYTKPRVEVVDPLGKLEKAPELPGKAFKATLKCGGHAGKALVQIVGEKEGSDALVASFPVRCGTPLPLAVKVPAAGTGPVDLAQAEKQVVDLVNADRAQADLKKLNPLPVLSDIARTLAQNRAQGKSVTSTELTKALRDADIAAPLVLESMAQAFSIDDAYTRFSESPTDRSNTMNADITDLGVGVVKGPMVGDKPTYVVAELFIKQRVAVDPAQVKAKLYEAIEKKRADARVPPPTVDKMLESVAQAYADAAAANEGRPTKEKETEILGPLYKESMTVNQIGGFLPDENTAVEVAEQPAIVGQNKLVGVGVAIGRSPQFGKGSPFVMVLLGTRHPPPKAVKRAPARRRK